MLKKIRVSVTSLGCRKALNFTFYTCTHAIPAPRFLQAHLYTPPSSPHMTMTPGIPIMPRHQPRARNPPGDPRSGPSHLVPLRHAHEQARRGVGRRIAPYSALARHHLAHHAADVLAPVAHDAQLPGPRHGGVEPAEAVPPGVHVVHRPGDAATQHKCACIDSVLAT